MKNKKNDGKYVIIDDGTAGGLFLSENEYYVDENKKVVLCNSEKKDNLFRKRYKLTHGDKCYSIIKYFCPEVEFISIKIMETGERGSIDSFKAALEWCLKEKIKLVHMSVGTTNYIDAKKIEKRYDTLQRVIPFFNNENLRNVFYIVYYWITRSSQSSSGTIPT